MLKFGERLETPQLRFIEIKDGVHLHVSMCIPHFCIPTGNGWMHHGEIWCVATYLITVHFTQVIFGAYLHVRKCAPFSISRKLEKDL